MPWIWTKRRAGRARAAAASVPCTAALRTVTHTGVNGFGLFAETTTEDVYHRCTWGIEHPGRLHVTMINGRPVWFE